MRFVKGHGTGNDFVLLPDLEASLALTPELVRALCDRRTGLGADGVLRVVRNGGDTAVDWFMDYRNADGSLAEMCGNGVRVFARYLLSAGLAEGGEIAIETRGGVVRVRGGAVGDLTADMGCYGLPDLGDVQVHVGGRAWPARAVTMPNPHAVVVVEDLALAGELSTPPRVTPVAAYPDGVNVEFVRALAPRALTMRVHERGSGETRSCGTGVCAAAVALAQQTGAEPPSTWTVEVPGGRLGVELSDDGRVLLSGPAVLVGEGELDAGWLASAGSLANPGAS